MVTNTYFVILCDSSDGSDSSDSSDSSDTSDTSDSCDSSDNSDSSDSSNRNTFPKNFFLPNNFLHQQTFFYWKALLTKNLVPN